MVPHRSGGYCIVYLGEDANHERVRIEGHRLVLAIAHGVPCGAEGMFACHWQCGKGNCLNPAHLRWDTKKEDVADKPRKTLRSSSRPSSEWDLFETEDLRRGDNKPLTILEPILASIEVRSC